MAFIYNETNNMFDGDTWNSPSSGPITVTQDGVIASSNFDALSLLGGAYTLTVNGLISSSFIGLYLDFPLTATQVSKVTIGTTGSIHGLNDAIVANHATNITNNGYISGQKGIFEDGGAVAFSIINTGTIDTAGQAIYTVGTGKHTITNSGDIYGTIFGNDISASIEAVSNSGYIGGDLEFYDGADSLANTGTIEGIIYMDEGADKLTNSGTIVGDVNGWTGADVMTNSGKIDGTVFLGEDSDTLTNSGTITGDMNAWTGNDKFTNTGTVEGWIFMGEGNDIFTGGAKADFVQDEGGVDVYKLGDGLDQFDAVGGDGSGDGSIDNVDGGANAGTNLKLDIYGDVYDAFNAVGDVFINLDSVARTEVFSGSSPFAAFTATGTDVGTDIVKNFEVVWAGGGNDTVFGNASANYIEGNDGDDKLYGGAGNDRLFGDAGSDVLYGEGGRDRLYGGGADSSTDYFSFKALTDSTVGHAGRDTLVNFNDAEDIINFRGLNLANDHWNVGVDGIDEAFDGTAGAVRALTLDFGWTIQLDSNGDRKVDMAIDVVDLAHAIAWDSSDFLFV
jgi:hypothetical protein